MQSQSCPNLCKLTRILCPWDFPGKNAGVCYHFLLQGIFPTQRSNLHLLHLLCWQADFFTASTVWLLKVTPVSTILLGVRISTYEFGMEGKRTFRCKNMSENKEVMIISLHMLLMDHLGIYTRCFKIF